MSWVVDEGTVGLMAQKMHCPSGAEVGYHLVTMWSLASARMFGKKVELPAAVAEVIAPESKLLITIGWLSAGLGAVAVGLFVGAELRQRYKFNRRTPYDFYAHSGDEMQEIEFGLGV